MSLFSVTILILINIALQLWAVPTADISDVYDTFETMCSITDMPFETEEIWISIDFDYIAN